MHIKKRRRLKRIVCLAMGVIFVAGIVQTKDINTQLYAKTTNESIKEKEEEISKAEEERKKLQAGLTDIKKVMADLETSKSNLANYVKKLDASLDSITKKLEELNSSIVEKQDQIAKTKEELEAAEEVETTQYEAMKERIKFMYEKGDTFYLEMILSAKNFGEFLNKSEYIAMLSSYDRKMLDEYIATKEAIEELKLSLEEEEKILQEAQNAVKEEQDAMSTLISAKEKEIKNYESDINNKSALVKDYEAEIAAQNATIQQLEAAVAEERRKLAEQNGTLPTYDGGQFAWPAPSYTRISDDYGNRIHPTLGVQQFHNGVDMAAPSGSPILAAYNGKVVQSAYNSSMGNYIMIDHGDSLYTIYMHASALYVSAGTTVTRGQKIAAVGSTGRSTGPHLHFSVRKNGNYVSPWNYLK